MMCRRGVFVAMVAVLAGAPASHSAATDVPPAGSVANAADSAFLDDLQRRGVQYFIDHCNPRTGLARDRAPANGRASDAPASIAATGFALTAWCIADARGWTEPGRA